MSADDFKTKQTSADAWKFCDYRLKSAYSDRKKDQLIDWFIRLKFGHSEKATKIWNNLPLDLTFTK